MSVYQHIKAYKNQYGLDLKSTDLNRLPIFASGLLNQQYKKSGGHEKRKGYQAHAAGGGGLGLFEYNKKSPVDGSSEAEVISVGQSAYRLRFTTITISYSNPAAIAAIFSLGVYTGVALPGETLENPYYYAFSASTSGYPVPQIRSLGLGFDELSTVTVDDIATRVNLTSGWTATVTGDGTVPGAFLTITKGEVNVLAGPLTLTAAYWEEVNTTVSNPFAAFYATRNDEDFEIMSGVQGSNVLYLSGGGIDYVQKYDGQTLYRAGLPDVASFASVKGAATGFTGTNYLYAARYVQYDAAGNLHEGNLLFTANEIDVTNEKINLTVANVLAGSGFNTNCAIVNGLQSGVTTITVDSGHTMKVGDTAFFYDGVSSLYVEREVTAITTTTIVIAGAAVDVADNAVISNNLRIELYRSKSEAVTPTSFYYLGDLPNNSFAATQAYVDTTADASLGALLIEPITDRSAPPKLKYLTMFQNQLCGCGVKLAPSTFYWSDVDGNEYFPADSNNSNLDTVSGDVLTGCAPNGEILAISKTQSMCLLSGNLADNQIRFDWLQGDVGCIAHATFKDVQGHLCWMSDRGPYRMVSGQLPEPLGDNADGGGRIEPIADQDRLRDDQKLVFKRAVAFNDRADQKYILYLPAEEMSGSNRHPNSNSRLYTWDYSRGMAKGAWLKWSNMNMAGGAVAFNGEKYFQERRYSRFTGAMSHNLYRRHNTGLNLDYEDNNIPVEWEYSFPWETLGHAAVYKKFLEVRLYYTPEEETPGNDDSIRIVTEANWLADVPIADVTVTPPRNEGYGVSGYGSAQYGDPSVGEFKKKLSIGKYLSLRVRLFNNEHHQNVDVTAIELEAAAPFKAEMKQ